MSEAMPAGQFSTAAIDRQLRQAADAKQVPGLVAMAATDAGVIHEAACGERELGKGDAMTPDTVVWVASFSKAITSAAALQLVERGKLALDAPAAKILPELDAMRVLTGFDAAGVPQLRPPRRAITLRHLLSHTAGFCYDIWNAEAGRYHAAAGTPNILTCQRAAFASPLLFDPGERWEYGLGVDWAGRVIEAASGQRLGDYFEQNLFAPLGMRSTSFALRPDQRARLAAIHVRAGGALSPVPFELPQEPEVQLGGAGLYSTAQDYLRFTRMLLGGGALDGTRVLSPESVQTMSQNQSGEHDCTTLRSVQPLISHDIAFYPGVRHKWGFGFAINLAPLPTGRSAGSVAAAGLANTYFWIDARQRVTGLFMTQLLPSLDPQVLSLASDYEQGIYAALGARA